LPFGQTACHWDKKLDHKALWIELRRLAKSERTPFFFSCTTKFGFELYNSAPKGWFRWDLVWKKNRAAGFLNAYRLPMRKHEMIYCFAKKSPDYDVSSHKDFYEQGESYKLTKVYDKTVKNSKKIKPKVYKHPLPTSDITPPTDEHELVYCFAKKCPEYDVSSHKEFKEDKKGFARNTKVYGLKEHYVKTKVYKDRLPTSDITPPTDEHELVYCFAKKTPEYDVSSHKEYKNGKLGKKQRITAEIYSIKDNKLKGKVYKDRLPSSDITPPTDEHELVYCFAKKCPEYDVSSHKDKKVIEYTHHTKRDDSNQYNLNEKKEGAIKNIHKDPLPTSDITPPTDEHELVYCFAKKSPDYDVSSHKEYVEEKTASIRKTKVYEYMSKKIKSKTHKDPLPTSDITPPTDEHELVYCFAKKSPDYDVSSHKDFYEDKTASIRKTEVFKSYQKYSKPIKGKLFKDPLPTSDITPSSWCEYTLDTKIDHRTAKPVKLMEFLLKYWTKEGATVCDPTAGSGSMGIACKNMNRKFIGIEKDDKIFQLMKDRIENHKPEKDKIEKGENITKP